MVLRYVQLAAHERLTAQPLAVRSLGAARVQVNDTGAGRSLSDLRLTNPFSEVPAVYAEKRFGLNSETGPSGRAISERVRVSHKHWVK
jgi:hypothetical protein